MANKHGSNNTPNARPLPTWLRVVVCAIVWLPRFLFNRQLIFHPITWTRSCWWAAREQLSDKMPHEDDACFAVTLRGGPLDGLTVPWRVKGPHWRGVGLDSSSGVCLAAEPGQGERDLIYARTGTFNATYIGRADNAEVQHAMAEGEVAHV